MKRNRNKKAWPKWKSKNSRRLFITALLSAVLLVAPSTALAEQVVPVTGGYFTFETNDSWGISHFTLDPARSTMLRQCHPDGRSTPLAIDVIFTGTVNKGQGNTLYEWRVFGGVGNLTVQMSRKACGPFRCAPHWHETRSMTDIQGYQTLEGGYQPHQPSVVKPVPGGCGAWGWAVGRENYRCVDNFVVHPRVGFDFTVVSDPCPVPPPPPEPPITPPPYNPPVTPPPTTPPVTPPPVTPPPSNPPVTPPPYNPPDIPPVTPPEEPPPPPPPPPSPPVLKVK